MKTYLRAILDRLPANWQLAMYRNYLYWAKRDYVRPEVDLFRRLCDPARAAIDIGANRGLYAIYLCRSAARLYCFEPLPWLAADLRRRFSRTPNVVIENCALGSSNEVAPIRIPVTRNGQYDTRSSLVGDFRNQLVDGEDVVSITTVPVRVCRLDDFALEDVGFVKIDVEGFEMDVLEGGQGTLVRSRPNLFVEIEQKHRPTLPIRDVFEYLRRRDYAGFFRWGGQWLSIDHFDVALHQRQDGVRADDYCGDFVFVPLGSPTLRRFQT